MKNNWKITAGILTVLFCMLIGCERKGIQEDFLLVSAPEEADGEEVAPEAGSKETVTGMPDARSAESGAETADTAEDAGPLTEKKELAVHICGAVHNPGVYFLEKGSRIYQAVEAAGGFTEAAGEEYINLAGQLTDGQKIYIPTLQEAEEKNLSKEGEKSGLTDAVEGSKINLNTASPEQLCTLPGIGMGKAENIIAYREAYGAFKTTEEIMKVEGIKEGLFQKIRDMITV